MRCLILGLVVVAGCATADSRVSDLERRLMHAELTVKDLESQRDLLAAELWRQREFEGLTAYCREHHTQPDAATLRAYVDEFERRKALEPGKRQPDDPWPKEPVKRTDD